MMILREEEKEESHEEGGMGLEEGTSAWRRRATLSACSRVSLTDMQRSLVAGTSGTIARDENEKKTKARREGGDAAMWRRRGTREERRGGETGGHAVANLKGRPAGYVVR